MPSRSAVALGFVLLGAGLLLNPYYLWPHHGVDAYELGVGQSLAGSDSPTPVEELPPETAVAVEAAVDAYEGDGDRPAFEGRDAVPTDGLRWDDGNRAVTVDGTSYVVRVDRAERSPPVLPDHPFVRVSMGFAGATALGLAAVSAVTGTVRLTTRRAWAFAPLWGLVLGATVWYDGGLGGVGLGDAGRWFLFDSVLGPSSVTLVAAFLVLLPAAGIAYGVALRDRGWRDARGRPRLGFLAAGLVGWPFMLPGMLLGVVLGASERDSGAADTPQA